MGKWEMADDFTINSLLPAAVTLAAALIAGGIARSNLIVAKETKISEFRQAWVDALREELAILFSSTRTMARATQETRAPSSGTNTKFHISQVKITEIRHAAAETHYKIKLRLNVTQSDHLALLEMLGAMMDAQNKYLAAVNADIKEVFEAAKRASDQAALVLKSEWETVKQGEKAYRSAVKTSTHILKGTGILLVAIVVGVPAYVFIFKNQSQNMVAQPTPTVPPTLKTYTPKTPSSQVVSKPDANINSAPKGTTP